MGRDNSGQISTGDQATHIQNIRNRKTLVLPLGLFLKLARGAGSAAAAHPVAALVTCVVVAGAVTGGVALQSAGSATAGRAGDSIGMVGSPLLGNTVYQGTPATNSGEAWYQVDKTGAATANIHVKDTAGADASCSGLSVSLDNSQGSSGQVSQFQLGSNSATGLPVTTPGLYYVEVTGDGCTPTSPTTFSIEPQTSAWISPVAPPRGTATTGASIGTVGVPLAGARLYRGTVATTSGEAVAGGLSSGKSGERGTLVPWSMTARRSSARPR